MIYCDKLRQTTVTSCDAPLRHYSTRHGSACCGDAVMATDVRAQENKLPGQKVGKRWRPHKAVIDRWLGNEGRLPKAGR